MPCTAAAVTGQAVGVRARAINDSDSTGQLFPSAVCPLSIIGQEAVAPFTSTALVFVVPTTDRARIGSVETL